MHFRGLWFTLMPTNFHSFSKTVVPQNGKEVHSGGIVGDDCRNY